MARYQPDVPRVVLASDRGSVVTKPSLGAPRVTPGGRTAAVAPAGPGGALIRNGEYADVWDMPTMSRGSGNKPKVNAAEVARILRECPPCTAYVELVNAMPGQGVVSMFQFGKCAGAIEAAMAALGFPMVEVTPQILRVLNQA